LSWRPIYDYFEKSDPNKDLLKGTKIETNPTAIFLRNSLLQYAGDFEAGK
jgi:hypothetical protein